ncbi:related to transposase [Sporisorium reilianum SRZ2]|uniref:Related to transposase n=1 Tax=Sporisorium reilianum (strain SRZ2) TaxID=999809 RepID=E6ZR30_SPORE|nr:related to transposase [Sporisorium reilianum SRZ2]
MTCSVPGRILPAEPSRNWLQSFLIRHPSIRAHWSRCLDNQRLTGAREDVIRQWFTSLSEIMRNFGITSTNVFNMDETSFMFGQAGSERIIIPSRDPASRFKAQPGTRELATVIECIGSGGQVLPPLIITKGVRHTVGEHRRMEGVPASWHFTKSSNGWTNNELAVKWLETIFDPSMRLSTRSEYRLLVINGHGSHLTLVFCDAAWSRQIIPLVLPAHATHIMQPLDVSIYAQAREKVLTQSAARKAFSDSGISINPSPEKVLRRLAGCSTAAGASRTPRQEPAVPSSGSAFNAALDATLDAHAQEPGSRNARALKRTLLEANATAQTSIAVLEAKVVILQAQHDRKSKTSAKLGRKCAGGDMRVLTKDRIITREEAERALAEKEASTSRNAGGNRQDEEEEVVAAPSAAVDDCDNASEDDDEALLVSPSTPSPPPTHSLLDELDDSEPLSTVDDDDPGGFGFFDTLPQAGPSRTKH